MTADIPVRSTLFKVDETHPSPPSVKEAVGDTPLNPPENKRYLCLVSFHGTCWLGIGGANKAVTARVL
jgi:hypothetical protein